MSVNTTLPISSARKKIFEIAEEAQKPDVYFTLTEKGKPKVVILSAGEFESLMETLEVMKDFPSLGKDVAEAKRDLKRGRYTPLENILTRQGFIRVKGTKRAYVSSHLKQPSAARSGKFKSKK